MTTPSVIDAIVARPSRPLVSAIMLVIVFALGAAALAIAGFEGATDNVRTEAELRARGAAADVDRYVQSQWFTLGGMASIPAVRGGDPAAMKSYFDTLDPAEIGLDAGVSFIDSDGRMLVRTGGYEGPPIDFSQRDHIRRALQTHEPTVSSAIVGTVNAVPVIAFTVPVFATDGSFAGLLGSGVRLDAVSIGADDLRYAGGTSVVVIDALGQVIAGPQPVEGLTPAAPSFPLDAIRSSRAGSLEGVPGPYGDADELVGYATAERAGWTVVVQTPAAAALGPARSLLVGQLAAILVGSLGGVALLAWAARRLERAAARERATLEELRVAVATLERRQALSDAFVGVMSHELRTPVTTIYGGLQLLLKNPDRPIARELLTDVAEEADRMRRITEDLLVVSRAEHGAVSVHTEPVLVQRVLPEVVADVRRQYPQVLVETLLPANLPAAAADESALRQAIANLLTNAAKHGAGSPVTIEADADGQTLIISVSDRGIGVAPSELPHLFDLFYRAPSNERRASGTGIGLFVVRELVVAMGGRITASPNDPHGLRFEIRLPVFAAESVAEPAAQATAVAVPA